MCRADLAPAAPQVGVGLVSALQLKPCGAQEVGLPGPAPQSVFHTLLRNLTTSS